MSDDRPVYGPCPPWCVDREFEGTPDHPATHTGPVFGTELDHPVLPGAPVLFLQAEADYGPQAADADAGVLLASPRISFAVADEPVHFWIAPPGARSLAAALVRLADMLEAGPM